MNSNKKNYQLIMAFFVFNLASFGIFLDRKILLKVNTCKMKALSHLGHIKLIFHRLINVYWVFLFFQLTLVGYSIGVRPFSKLCVCIMLRMSDCLFLSELQ
uniref:Uncharacterized protein n=1 Tax=Opuntia streptacantha TaxID=393608 RepID=A0A7C8YWK4_OPUST